jgi:hypothetical protein
MSLAADHFYALVSKFWGEHAPELRMTRSQSIVHLHSFICFNARRLSLRLWDHRCDCFYNCNEAL